MQSIIGFLNDLAPVIETAIAQQKAVAPQRQIFLVISRNSIRNKSYTRAVEFSTPALSGGSSAQLHGAIYFGVGVGLMAAFVPAPACENAEPVIEGLFEVCAKAVLY